MQTNYSHDLIDDLLIINFAGDLIGEQSGPELMEIINDRINQKVLFAAIDISDIRYINSSGIGVLITILTKFRNKGGEVLLVNPSEHVKKLLIITKLNAIFTIVNTIEEARATIKK
ncbi:MAG: STAS domain-containing protein [Cyclobacteriaceae bacterium]